MCVNYSEYAQRGDAERFEVDEPTASDAISLDWMSITTSRSALEETLNRAFRSKILKHVAELMQDYPTVPLVVTKNKIALAYSAPDGFPMSIVTECGRYVVHLGKWRDEFVHAQEAVDIIEMALRGEIRLRVDIDARGERSTAERRLPDGHWIALPRFDFDDDAPLVTPVRTLYLRNIMR